MAESEKDWFKSAPVDKVSVITAVCAVIAVIIFVTLSAIYGDRGEEKPNTETQAPKKH